MLHAQAAKVYVQHRLGESARAVHDALMKQNGVAIIAGSAKQMPTDVTNALKLVSLGLCCGGWGVQCPAH